jgi:hypothetical protein
VQLHHGEYSDHIQESYFIRANDRDEAWYLFKEYWKTVAREHDKWNPCLVLLDSDGRYVEQFAPYPPEPKYEGSSTPEEWNFDTNYGDAQGVYLDQLSLIEFKS